MGKFGNAVKRAARASSLKRLAKQHQLRWLEIEITRRCPLACLHCGSSCSADQYYEQELPTETILSFLRRMDEAYGAKNIMVCFTGGEPLVREDLFRVMARTTDMGYRATMVTNGMLVTEKTVDLLAAAGLSTITVSLDGLEQTHNRVRGNPESFGRAVNALAMLKSSGHFHVVEALTCVGRAALSELPEIRKLLGEMDIDHWRLTRVFPIGRAKEYPELILNGDELRRMLDFILAARKTEPEFISYGEEGCLRDPYEFGVRDGGRHCDAGVNILTLLADGSLTGCASVDHGFIQGNILTDDPARIWEERFAPFRNRDWMREGICGSCDEWNYCRGDGIHLWRPGKRNPADCVRLRMQEKGDILGP